MATYYLAGQMSGIPQCNFPLFDRVAKTLREQGYNIVSPAELDDTTDRGIAMKSHDGLVHYKTGNKTWGDFLARDVKLLADGGITGIIFLPGWEKSKGAKLEAFVGLLSKFNFMRWDEQLGVPVPYSSYSVLAHIHHELEERT